MDLNPAVTRANANQFAKTSVDRAIRKQSQILFADYVNPIKSEWSKKELQDPMFFVIKIKKCCEGNNLYVSNFTCKPLFAHLILLQHSRKFSYMGVRL